MSNSTLTHTRTIFVSVCLSVFFSYAAHQYLLSYSAFEKETARLRIAQDQITQAREQQKRVNQYNKAMETFAKFKSQASLFNLTPKHWQSYDVSVDKSLSFAQAGNILDQLSHEKTYYFMPVHLFIGTGNYRNNPRLSEDSDIAEEVPLAVPQPDANSEESGDVSFAIQGKFMVRDSQ